MGKNMNRFVLRQSLLLFLTATIWGVAFVAQSVGMEYIGPFTFNAVRSLLGAFVLLPCVRILEKGKKKAEQLGENREHPLTKKTGKQDKNLWIGGICCGVCLFVASNLQQFGILYTTVGKAGFITAMYIVIVPILGIFTRKKTGKRIWAAVVLAVAGLYLLCMTEGNIALNKGDLLVGCCAVVFSLHILIIDYFAPRVDGVRMSCIQFFVCGLLSLICMFLFETPELSLILQAWLPVLYAGVLSCGVAYTLQIVGQRGMNPTVASLILSMESVVSLIAGWIILGQKMSGRELVGCGLMFLAIILAQL
jgi:drug/metabolite transporter (DMT)-like permease